MFPHTLLCSIQDSFPSVFFVCFITSVALHKDLGNLYRRWGLDYWKTDLQTNPQTTIEEKAGSLMFCKRISLVQVTTTHSRHQHSATTLHASLVWGVQSALLANSFLGPEILITQGIPPGYPWRGCSDLETAFLFERIPPRPYSSSIPHPLPLGFSSTHYIVLNDAHSDCSWTKTVHTWRRLLNFSCWGRLQRP